MNINILQDHNPWWRRPEFILEDNFIAELERQKYPYYHPFYRGFPLDKDGIVTLRGPRRIGKTTLLKLLIKKILLEKKINKENVFFYPCDTISNFKELEEVLVSYLNYIRPKNDYRLFIFLDEISFVREWQRAIKLLADTGKLKNTLVLITGSNILDLKFSSERLPGRRGKVFPWDINFLPLTFNEFINLVNPKLLEAQLFASLSLLPQFQKLFADYLLCGGFPATINEYFAKGYIADQTYEIFLNWIEGDLHRVGKSEISSYQIITRLFSHLTSQTSFYKLSREAGIASHTTVEEYLEILEKMYILFRLPYFSLPQKQVFIRKNSKLYFSDPFIFNALKAKVSRFSQEAFRFSREYISDLSVRPALVENAVSYHLHQFLPALYFGKGSDDKEIDFIGFFKGKYSFFEVKYQEDVDYREFLWAKEILGRNKLIVLTKNDFQEGKINLVPAELFLGYFPKHWIE